MAYSAVKDQFGNYIISQDGQRISTGIASELSRYGLSESQLSTPPAPVIPPTPPTTRYADTGGVPGALGSAFGAGGIFGDRTLPTADEEAKIRETERARVQAQIDAINEIANRELADISARSQQGAGRTRAMLSATGQLGGAGEGRAFTETERPFIAERQLAEKQRAANVATILTGVETRSKELIANERTLARENTDKYLAYLTSTSEKARADMTALATAQHDLSPDKKQQLMDQTGYDAEIFDTLYKSIKIASAPKADYINKDKPEIIKGADGKNKAVYFKQTKNADGTLGPITTETVDLPTTAANAEIQQIVPRDDGLYVFYKPQPGQTKGTWEKVGEPDKTAALDMETKRLQNIKLGQEIEKAKKEAAGSKDKTELLTNYQLANEILNDPKLPAIVGLKGPSSYIPGTAAQLTYNKFKQLQSILSLENRQKLKGQGAVSDFEGKMLSAAATSLDTNLSNEDAKKVLATIRGVFANAAGLSAPVKVMDPKTGQSKTGTLTRDAIDSAITQGYIVEYTE